MSDAMDKFIAARVGLLFGSLMVEYEIYRACEDEAELELMRDQFAQRLRGLRAEDKETVIVFMIDIFAKIGPDKLKLLLEEYEAAETE